MWYFTSLFEMASGLQILFTNVKVYNTSFFPKPELEQYLFLLWSFSRNPKPEPIIFYKYCPQVTKIVPQISLTIICVQNPNLNNFFSIIFYKYLLYIKKGITNTLNNYFCPKSQFKQLFSKFEGKKFCLHAFC